MMPALLLVAAAQGAAPTVGDTIWVLREVAIPAGRTVRPADWEPEDPVELLGPPRVIVSGGSARIAYPVVVWVTGEHVLRPPGPLLLGPDGTVDSLPPEAVTLQVASVLPVVPPDSTLRPQPRAEFVPRGARTPLPALLLLALAALLLAPVHWWWRRRGTAPAAAEAATPPRPPLDRWAGAGESRAVAAAVTGRLRSLLETLVPAAHTGLDTAAALAAARHARPEWPHPELGDLLRSLDEARFGNASFPDTVGLARWAGELEPRLLREAAA
ncbi:MAG: hypothetical protein H0W29_02545 [Gemmatimonadales bacterium]|nr:hypothetical protein [Gemmatimonadales bacterium]